MTLLAAAGGVAGYLLLTDPKQHRHDRGEELFTAEECREADAHIRSVLGGRQGEAIPSVLREIPRDEEATEADFQ